MRHFARFLIVVLLLLTAIPLSAQIDVTARNIYLKEGLSQSTVICINQDSRGLLWFGTQNGLNCYDGSKITVYRHDPADDKSLSFSEIYGICEDDDGSLWIATANGLNRFDRSSGTFTRYLNDPKNKASLSANFISSMTRDRSGSIWLATLAAVDRFDPRSGEFKHYYVAAPDGTNDLHKRIASLFIDSAGTLWCGARSNVLYNYDAGTDAFVSHVNPDTPPTELPDNQQLHRFSIVEEKPGVLLLGAAYYGVFRYSIADGSFEPFNAQFNAVTSANQILVTDIRPVSDDEVWVCTFGGGVFRLQRGKAMQRYFTGNADLFGVNSDYFISMLQDRSGLLWLASLDHGAFAIRHDKFVRYVPTDLVPSGLSNKVAMSVFRDTDGTIYVGHFDSFDRIDPVTGVRSTYKQLDSAQGKVTVNNIMLIRSLNDKTLLMAGYPFGLMRVDKKSFRAERVISSPLVFGFTMTRPDLIWLAALQEGVYRINPLTGEQKRFALDASTGVDFTGKFFMFAIGHDDGHVWVGTNSGLYHYDSNTNTAVSYWDGDAKHEPGAIPSKDILYLTLAAKGGLWVGTSDGLFLIRDGQPTRSWTTAQGLPDNTAYAVAEDDEGAVWIGTNKGLVRLEPDSGAVELFDTKDGLPSQEFNQAAVYRTADGTMLFGTMDGIAIFDPKKVRPSSFDPPVVISQFIAGAHDDTVAPGEPLSLPWERHDVTFSFAGLDFTVPDRIRYSYILEGYDQEWTVNSAVNFARYTNLPAGNFTFRVKSTNGDGIIGGNEAHVTFEVLPPWWQTWWFRGLAVLGTIAVFIGIAAAWNGNVKRQRDRLQKEVLARTAEIKEQRDQLADANKELETFNYSVSHDLRSPLNIIQQLCQILETDYAPQLDDQGRKLLAGIGQSAGRMTDLINSLLNLSKATRAQLTRVNTDLGIMAQEIASSLERRTPDRHVEWQIQEGLRVSVDESLLRIALTNLLENAWKYSSHGAHAAIEFGAMDDPQRGRVFYVRDNGIGFDPADADKLFTPFVRLHGAAEFPGTGIGLTTVQRIIQRHGGEIWAEAQVNKGATMKFTLG